MPSSTIRKEHASNVGGLDFVLSDESVDRMGDIIRADGWDLSAFSSNPIALFSHRADFPIGKWVNLRIDRARKALVGTLQLAARGTSDRIDELRRLVEAGILKAVSVGFRALAHQPRKDGDGTVFLRQQLIEVSLVAIPANPNALAVATSLNVSQDVRQLVFRDDRIHRATAYGLALLAATASSHSERDKYLERLRG